LECGAREFLLVAALSSRGIGNAIG
jgi:hypothetical protein